MTNEREILKAIIDYHAKTGAYPTIGGVAVKLRQKARAVATVVVKSRRIDYTVPALGEKKLAR